MTPFILIADALEVYRSHLRVHVEACFPACRLYEVSSMSELLDVWAKRKPTLVLLDVSLRDERGLRSAVELQSESPGTHVIYLSTFDDPSMRDAFMRNGAAGLVNKIRIESELLPLMHKLLMSGSD